MSLTISPLQLTMLKKRMPPLKGVVGVKGDRFVLHPLKVVNDTRNPHSLLYQQLTTALSLAVLRQEVIQDLLANYLKQEISLSMVQRALAKFLRKKHLEAKAKFMQLAEAHNLNIRQHQKAIEDYYRKKAQEATEDAEHSPWENVYKEEAAYWSTFVDKKTMEKQIKPLLIKKFSLVEENTMLIVNLNQEIVNMSQAEKILKKAVIEEIAEFKDSYIAHMRLASLKLKQHLLPDFYKKEKVADEPKAKEQNDINNVDVVQVVSKEVVIEELFGHFNQHLANRLEEENTITKENKWQAFEAKLVSLEKTKDELAHFRFHLENALENVITHHGDYDNMAQHEQALYDELMILMADLYDAEKAQTFQAMCERGCNALETHGDSLSKNSPFMHFWSRLKEMALNTTQKQKVESAPNSKAGFFSSSAPKASDETATTPKPNTPSSPK